MKTSYIIIAIISLDTQLYYLNIVVFDNEIISILYVSFTQRIGLANAIVLKALY